MNPQLWKTVRNIAEDALDHEGAEREAFLASACSGDDELRREIETLLNREDETREFLEAPTSDIVCEMLSEFDAVERSGEHVGEYMLDDLIAVGGMGAVFKAHRADQHPPSTTVAIKILRPGLGSRSIVRRFRDERRLLARLDHPAICDVLDGGTTDDGRPYIVMEYVEGCSIAEHCEQQHAPLRDRIALVRDVCAAVQHAHQRLIIHRDLKPANILITQAGSVKLLDFGISKLLDPDEDTPDPTATLMRVLTPRYASPEQIRGEPVTTASDIYSLGAVLYELVAGKVPLEFDTTLAGMLKVAEHEEPAPPSSLNTEISRDLEAVVLKALAKVPADRYASIEALSDDLDRYLVGNPVRAKPATRLDKFAKWTRKHRLPISIAAGVFLLMTAMAITSTILAIDLSRQRTKADTALESESKARTSADEINTFLASALTSADPFGDQGARVELRVLLDDATANLDTDTELQPQSRVALHTTIGRAYAGIGLLANAQEHLEEALNTARDAYEPSDPALSGALTAMASLLDGDAAQPLLIEALDIQRKNNAQDMPDPAVAAILESLSAIDLNRGNSTLAIEHAAAALAIRRAHHAQIPSPIDLGWGIETLARAHALTGDPDSAEPLLTEALAIYREYSGEAADETIRTLNNFAALNEGRGDFNAAESQIAEALALIRQHRGNDHPTAIHQLLELARLAQRRTDFDDAEEFLREAERIALTSLPEWHYMVALSRRHLGVFLMTLERYEEAETLLLAVHSALSANLGETHAATAAARETLAMLYDAWDKPNEAAHWRTSPPPNPRP